MSDVKSEDVRRVLGLALQILEDRPEWLQPKSDTKDMRAVLAGEDTGRIKNELITAEATATVLVWRTQQAVNHPVDLDGFTNCVEEFHAMFELMQHIDAWTFAIEYTNLLDRLGRLRKECKVNSHD